ncbi:hypothetical protein VPHK482G1_0020 [Vibrio phage K482 g1]
MSEENYNPELEAARNQADSLGVEWKPQQKAETIQKNIKKHKEALEAPAATQTPVATSTGSDETTVVIDPDTGLIDRSKLVRNTLKYGRLLYHPKVRMALHKEANKLVRVKITCMNPAKKEWKGEVFSVTNAIFGTIKKFVPYNVAAADAYHVPQALLTMMQDKEYQAFSTVRVKGVDTKKPRQVKEFAIEVLPPLTKQELEAIAKKQIMEDKEE